jgi:glycosyltransferase involved in cell wall biosynthesis
MQDTDIVLISAQRENISAERIRIEYFRQALVEDGYNVKVYSLKVTEYNKYFMYLLRRPPRTLTRIAKSAEVIVATSPPLINVLIGYKVAQKYNIKLVIDIRDIWEEYAKIKWHLFSRVRLVDKIVKYYYEALKYAVAVTTVTDKMKQYYVEKLGLGEKLHVVYNGTDPDIIKCHNDERSKDLVYLGNFDNPYHAVEFLLQTLKYNDLTLVIVGNGKYLEKIRKAVIKENVGKRVEFVGKVAYKELPKYLCSTKVGVIGRPFTRNPAYLYAIPVKTYDYLAASLSLAGYGPKGSAYGEFIISNDVGIYTWNNDAVEFSRQLTSLVERSSQMRSHARSLALKYDRKRWAKTFAQIVDKILSR